MTDASGSLAPSPWWRRCWRWCFGFEPMRHAPWETFLFRVVIALVAFDTIRGPSHKMAQPQPHGMAAWGVDFTWLGDPQLAQWLVPAWGVCLLLYIGNVAPALTLLPPLVASFGHGTLGNSSGAIGHTTQIVTLTLLGQWLAAAWAYVCAMRRAPLPHEFTRSQLAADWTRQIFMSTYVVSAISKLVQSGGLWFRDAPYFGLQIVKALGMARYGDYGQGREVQWLAQVFLDHPLAAKLFIGGALPLELFAFLALMNRRMALVFGLGLAAFHFTVTEIMNLGFVYHKTLLLALFVNPVWWAVEAGKRFAGRGERG